VDPVNLSAIICVEGALVMPPDHSVICA
jgi:hypothetical protein